MIEVNYTAEGEYAIVTFQQNLDSLQLADVRSLLEKISSAGCPMIIINLEKVRKVSTSGLGLIHTLANRAEDAGLHSAFLCSSSLIKALQEKSSRLLVAESENKAKLMLRNRYFNATRGKL